jgi:hypothetical protein
MEPEDRIKCSYRYIRHVAYSSFKVLTSSKQLFESELSVFRRCLSEGTYMDNVVNRLKGHVTLGVSILCLPLCRCKDAPCRSETSRHHSVDSIGQVSRIVLGPLLTLSSDKLRTKESIGSSEVVDTIEASVSVLGPKLDLNGPTSRAVCKTPL